MKRPLLLACLLAVMAAAFVGLFAWLVLDGSTPGAARPGGASAPAGERDGVALRDQSDAAAADLAAPDAAATAAAGERTSAKPDEPKVAVEGRVLPPAGCNPDEEVDVLAVNRACDIDDALRGLRSENRARERGRDPFGFDLDDVAAAPVRLAGMVRAGADGRFRVEVPESLEKVHLIAIGRSWFQSDSREFDPRDAAQRIELQTECGAWITGDARVPAGRELAEIEGLEVTLETNVQAMDNQFMNIGRSRRRAAIAGGAFEFRALPATAAVDLRAAPEKLANVEVGEIELVAGRGSPVTLEFKVGGTVRGTVRGDDGAPIPGAEVMAKRKGSWFGFDDRTVRSAKTAADGSFELVGVMPGPAEVKAQADDWLESAGSKVDLQDGGVVTDVVLELSRGAAITGTLHWPDGRPAAGIEVDVTFDRSQLGGMGAFNALRGARGQGETGADGRFQVRGLGAGPFTVQASALAPKDEERLKDEKRAVQRRHEHRARADGVKPGSELALVLRPPTGVRGRVIDALDQPIAKFTIAGNSVGTGMLAEVGQEQRSESFDTEDGTFLLSGLHDGKWKLRANAEGFAESDPLELSLPLADDAEPVTYRLQRACTARGVVLSPAGTPVVGAEVEVDDGQPAWARALSSAAVPKATTDAGGRFELKNLKPGKVALVADHKEYARSPELALEFVAGQEAGDLVLRLLVGGKLTGEVFQDGKPAPGMMVQVQDMKRFGQNIGFSDNKGRFEFEHLDPGTYQVVAMPAKGDGLFGDGEEPDPMAMMSKLKMATAEITDGTESHVVLGAPPEDPVQISGRVLHAGVPVAGATVMFTPASGGKGLSGLKPAQTKKDGSFALTLDAPGPHNVSVQRMSPQMDAQSVYEVRVDVPKVAHHEVDVALPEGRISGFVRGPDGKPAASTRVSIAREDAGRPGTFWGGQFHELRTDAEGNYDAQGLEAGTYTVSAGGSELVGMLGGGASPANGRTSRGGVRLEKGEWLRDLDLRLTAPGSIEVTIVDDAGKPVTGAVVFARDGDGRKVDQFSFVTSDGTGTANYLGLGPGSYTFRARTGTLSSSESAPVRLEEGGKAAVRIVLEKGSMLHVKVLGAEKEPLVASIQVYDPDGHEIAGQIGLSEIMERFQSGGFDFEEQKFGPFAPGKYRVVATLQDGRSESKPVTLSRTGERKITISFD